MTPHKHAELIKAWADGAEIECCVPQVESWVACKIPVWMDEVSYRIKPEKKWYRVAEFKDNGVTWVGALGDKDAETRLSERKGFFRWITDRIYYE